MDSEPASLDFAIIGHQEDWRQVAEFVNALRKPQLERLSEEKVKAIFPFLPPLNLFGINVNSSSGKTLRGAYIETFIAPDALETKNIHTNVLKVRNAARVAEKLGAKIATLGGFSSIVIEGNTDLITTNGTPFTTGNTLTSAFIVKGVEKAAEQLNLQLSDSNLLVIGATGDIGQAVTRYFSGKVKEIFLSARNENRLRQFAGELDHNSVPLSFSTSINHLAPEANIIISVASSSSILLRRLKHNVLICDAGYPKNLDKEISNTGARIFHGGMGAVKSGFTFSPDYTDHFYKFPAKHAVHGCVLEAIVLSFENVHESFSKGKGNISIRNMEKIYSMALTHGIDLAPFYNANGLWNLNGNHERH